MPSRLRKSAGLTGKCRLVRLTQILFSGKTVTAKDVVDEFGVSWAQAKKDLVLLEQLLPVDPYSDLRPQTKCLKLKC